ncbi:uncharacterized protein Z518_10716 [Rhinocladiella mackenziei CBS 650.93]|uniref:Uncharacterized protein n=1 Tax=Rhinocladiella mackenziei CBS 650.93 TaxID=1442369 RepID=A0A0D2I216_9EURO|nr:uncharacterized protein Z518_10716 [Rhinocladiella mackenziei CBS 650.93]KIW99788.1 hypothetical protein Z518_10716 [Rhinocladiella mackenziei CBS 650.93]
MDQTQSHVLLSPPASAASPTPSASSIGFRNLSLPVPRSHRLRPGSQKEIALINYLDDRILRITRRYAKKFSNEVLDNDDSPGYTTYDEFVSDADPLVDVVWISGTPTIQIPYLLSLAGLTCSYLQAFPFSVSLFYITSKIDQGFSSLLHSSEENNATAASHHHVSMTEKVRIKSLIEETRVAAVHSASASGHVASIQDISDVETEDEDEDDSRQQQTLSISLRLSRIYKRTLEILGDSLVTNSLPQNQDIDTEMS